MKIKVREITNGDAKGGNMKIKYKNLVIEAIIDADGKSLKFISPVSGAMFESIWNILNISPLDSYFQKEYEWSKTLDKESLQIDLAYSRNREIAEHMLRNGKDVDLDELDLQLLKKEIGREPYTIDEVFDIRVTEKFYNANLEKVITHCKISKEEVLKIVNSVNHFERDYFRELISSRYPEQGLVVQSGGSDCSPVRTIRKLM
jgi:hypothetical protein